MSGVSSIKTSHDCKTVASADVTKNIYLWDASSKEITNNRFVFHSSKVYEMDWSSDDKMLISGSLDMSVIVWDVETKERIREIPKADIEVVLTIKFVNDKQFICGGHSSVPTLHNI